MASPLIRRTASAFSLLAVLIMASCGGQSPGAPTGGGAGSAGTAETPCENGEPAPTIAYIAPNNDDPRYETHDRPAFEAGVKALSPNSTFLYYNSEGSVEKQQEQARAAMVEGVDVISFVPNDVKAAAAIVREAHEKGVKVISLGRLVDGEEVDFLVSYDPVEFGRIQAGALIDAMKDRGTDSKPVVMINGAPTDDLAVGFAEGAREAFEAAGIEVGFDQDDTDWTAATAERLMDQAITALGKDEIGGVFGTVDLLSAAIISSMKRAGMDPTQIPVSGANSNVDGIQRVLVGEQASDLYSSIVNDHQMNAAAAVALGCDEPVPADVINGSKEGIDAFMSEWHIVTKDNIKEVIVDDNPNFLDLDVVCAPPYDEACQEQGLTN